MAKSIRAGYFWIRPTDDSPKPVQTAVEQWMRKAQPFEFSHYGNSYLAEEFDIDARGIVTGVINRIHSSGLPRVVDGRKTHDLPLQANESLGEPMCFAYHPNPGLALIHYSHNGPRHPVMTSVIGKMGYPKAILVEPLLKADMLAKLKAKKFITAVEFGFTEPEGIKELRGAKGALGDAIDVLDELGGVSIHVTVTMGHSQGEGMIVDTAKRIIRTLAEIGTERVDMVDSKSRVTAAKLRGADDDDSPLEMLDMLKARELVTLMVNEQGRHLDRTDCKGKLGRTLWDNRDLFREQMKKRS